MKIAIYLAAVPKNKSEIKIAALRRFGQGISILGDTVEYVTDHRLVDADVALLQGFVHRDVASAHLQLRRNVLDNNENTIIIDSNLFQFANPDLANYYLRYSLNGIFPHTGFYFDNKIDNTRWESISRKLDIELKPYSKGRHILICLQRVDGWSMDGTNVQTWLDSTVAAIRQYTDRPIVVRKHPGDRKQEQLRFSNDYKISTNATIVEDFYKAHATVTYNSSPGVASLINGVPAFVTDPESYRSQTNPICNTDLSTIENPILFDREEWVNRISQSHWNEEEIAFGEAWRFMRERLCLLRTNLS